MEKNVDQNIFQKRLARLTAEYDALVTRPNLIDPEWSNGVFERYCYPVLTAAHTPLSWRYDLNPATNPYFNGAVRDQRRFQPGRDRVRRQDMPGVPRGGLRPQIVFCHS